MISKGKMKKDEMSKKKKKEKERIRNKEANQTRGENAFY